jgi:hypothetical protein
MNTTCPSCGRPVRPGTKFCGNCGATLPAVPAAKPPTAEGASSVTPAAGQTACPHCEKPVRLEARFCPNCGQTLVKAGAVGAAAPATPPPGVLKPVTPPPQAVERSGAQPKPVQQAKPSPTPAQKPVPSTAPPASAAKPAPPKRSGRFWLLVGGAISIIIIFGAFSAWGISKSGIFARDTETPTTTATWTATTTFTLQPSETLTLAPTLTLIPPPSDTATITPTLTATTTETPPADIILTPTASILPPAGAPVLSESFSGDLADLAQRWTVWGTAFSLQDGMLELKGLTPTDTGLTSKQEFLARENTIIQFEVTLLGNSSQHQILFNWDPKTINRNPNTNPGPIHMQIGGENPAIKVGLAELPLPLLDNQLHKFEIKILKDSLVSFSIDGREIGKLPLPRLPIINGKISFSGSGRIDNINVFTPTEIIPTQSTLRPTNKPGQTIPSPTDTISPSLIIP